MQVCNRLRGIALQDAEIQRRNVGRQGGIEVIGRDRRLPRRFLEGGGKGWGAARQRES